jgi:hypothetical protein
LLAIAAELLGCVAKKFPSDEMNSDIEYRIVLVKNEVEGQFSNGVVSSASNLLGAIKFASLFLYRYLSSLLPNLSFASTIKRMSYNN